MEWKNFNVIDTGGFVQGSEDVFEREIAKQVLVALEEANVILFMVDAATGRTDLDDSMVELLRKSTKPVFVVVNKVDNNERLLEASEFYALGLEPVFIAAASGSGTGELLDAITELMPAEISAELPEGIGFPSLPSSVSQIRVSPRY